MKKVLLSFVALVLLGAGCTFGSSEGEWDLSFDMPRDWVMVQHYKTGSEPVDLEAEISTDLVDIVLQSTSKHIQLDSSVEISEEDMMEIGEVVSEDYAFIWIFKLDERRVIPSNIEDLGNGFYVEDMCGDDAECQQGSDTKYEYYLETDNAKYQFKVWEQGQAREDIDAIITSATETIVE